MGKLPLARIAALRIQVVAADSISPQARAYAEYRIFAALSQVANAERVRHARVVLAPTKRVGGCDRVACTVTVDIDGTDALRVRAIDDHAYAAINNAVDHLTGACRPIGPSPPNTTRVEGC